MNVFADVHPLRLVALLLVIGVVVLFIGWALRTLFANAHRCNRFTFWLWLAMYLLVILPIPAFVIGHSFERLVGPLSGDRAEALRGLWFVTMMLWLLPMFLLALRYAKRYPPPDQHQQRGREV